MRKIINDIPWHVINVISRRKIVKIKPVTNYTRGYLRVIKREGEDRTARLEAR